VPKSKHTRGRKAAPVLPTPPKPHPLRDELDAIQCDLDNAVCVLRCVVQTLGQADDVTKSEDLSRALSVARHSCPTFDRISERLDELSLRIAHEGIPAQYPKAKGKRAIP
jgi:hypothetical protein